jgi:L-seryl-tRNA(Ser) seleniumtransferase
MSSPRLIPSIDALMNRPALLAASLRHGRAVVVDAVREAAHARRSGGERADSGEGAGGAAETIERDALARIEAARTPSLQRVINATGVILHTNLGRAPLAEAALAHAARVGGGFSNLEYDLDPGARGHRHRHAARLLASLTGAEAALVANNNAAATLVTLAALAAGREVVVSRGELVEIGGGFRVPEILAQSGAVLREVGTTNRTRVSDYAAAISERTGAILRVHPSNFRMEGFTERPGTRALADVAHAHGLPIVEDLGSGWLGLADVETPEVLREEPSVRASLADGVDVVTFSGDKLLGGPQAGIALGGARWIDLSRRHPLMRAVRADKMTYALLEGTLELWTRPGARTEIPVFGMLTMPLSAIDARARALADELGRLDGLRAAVVDGASTIGGGSAPEETLPTRLVALDARGADAGRLAASLRRASPPVIARVGDGRLHLDLRTVAADDDARVIGAIRSVLASSTGRWP